MEKFNKNHLSAIHAEAKDELKEIGRHVRFLGFKCPVTGKYLSPNDSRWITAEGLGELVGKGAKEFEEATNHQLPHNLIFTAMSGALTFGSVPFRYGGMWCSNEGADRLLKEYGRYSGWLKTSAKLPAVKKALMKGQSSRGTNSDYTYFSLGVLIKKYPSPHRLERALWKARKRADEMLASWPGERRWASWAQLAVGLIQSGRPGKAAVIAVATTLGGGSRYGVRYQAARNWLVKMRTANFPVEDTSDGVIGRRAELPAYFRHGISIFRLRVEERNYFVTKFLVRHERSGRTYHADDHGSYHSVVENFKWAVKAAMRAWSEQDRIANQEADLVGFLRGDEGYCPMIVREHSYRAGNCSAGTEAWARQMGFASHLWIPGQVLITHLADERVRRVAYACREAFMNVNA